VGTAAVTVRGLCKAYGERRAVDGIDLDVAAAARILGHAPAAPTPAWRARIGIVLQTATDLSKLTVTETVTHFACNYPTPRARCRGADVTARDAALPVGRTPGTLAVGRAAVHLGGVLPVGRAASLDTFQRRDEV